MTPLNEFLNSITNKNTKKVYKSRLTTLQAKLNKDITQTSPTEVFDFLYGNPHDKNVDNVWSNYGKLMKFIGKYDAILDFRLKLKNEQHELKEKYISENFSSRDDLTTNTVKHYDKMINLISNQLENDDVKEWIKHPDIVGESIDEISDNIFTKQSLISSIYAYIQTNMPNDERLLKIYGLLLKEINDEIRDLMNMNASDSVMDWKHIQRYANDYNPDNIIDTLILRLYTQNPPLRSEYARNVMIFKKQPKNYEDKNYLVLDNGNPYVVFNDFKNSKTLGSVKITLHFLKKYPQLLQYLNKKVNEFLFDMNEVDLQKRLKNLMNKAIGYPYGVRELRRSYETYLQKQPFYINSNEKDRESYHNMLLHSMNIGKIYRNQKS